MNAVSLVPIKKEGCAVHPDEMASMSDEAYKRQLKAYISSTGDKSVICSRPDLHAAAVGEMS